MKSFELRGFEAITIETVPMGFYSLADSGVDLNLRCIENVLTDYDSQHLQE